MSDPLHDLRVLRQAALEAGHESTSVAMLTAGSIEAAWSKLTGSREAVPATLLVELGGTGDLQAAVAAAVSESVQKAIALIVRGMRNPSKEVRQLYAGDIAKASLTQRGQVGHQMVFEVQRRRAAEGEFGIEDQASMIERALSELVEVLPENPQDDRALDAIIGQRVPVRLAVGQLVAAATRARGLDLTLTIPGHDPVASVLSADQAVVLKDSLAETDVERRVTRLFGRLDGVRTKRRIFYLEDADGKEITGAIDEGRMRDVHDALDQLVQITVEVSRTRTKGGRVGKDHFRLIDLTVHEELPPADA